MQASYKGIASVRKQGQPVSVLVPRGVEAGNTFIAQSSTSGARASLAPVYDPLRRIVKIVETTGGTISSTKQFVWAGDQLCEERDSNGDVTRRFFSNGEQIAGTNYYYTRDHLGSLREMTDGSGNVVAGFSYDPFGRRTKLQGTSPEPSFGYTGMYSHQRSGLNMAVNRAYSADLGRFINRDPIAEEGGINLFAYVNNDPLNLVDPLGEIGHPPRLPRHPICYIERRYDPNRPFTGPFSGNYGAVYQSNYGYTPPSPPTSFGSVPEMVYPPDPVHNQNVQPSPPAPEPQPQQPYPPPVPVGPDGILSPPAAPPVHIP